MAVTYRSMSSVTYAGGHTTETLTPPSGLSNDDILILSVYAESSVVLTPPAGFTLVQSQSISAVPLQHVVWWKRASSESGNYVVTHAGGVGVPSSAMLAAYSGCIATGDPVNVSNSAQSVTNFPDVAVTTTVANTHLLYLCSNEATGAGVTPPTGFTERGDFNQHELSDKLQAASGATGNIKTGTTSSYHGVSILIALAPPASGGTTYTQALTGNCPSASGINVIKTLKNLAGTNTAPSGSLVKSINKNLAGINPVFSGGLIKQINFSVLGNFPNSTGNIFKLIYLNLLGDLTSATGVASSSGVSFNQLLSGVFPSGNGSVIKTIGKGLIGGFTSGTGEIVKNINKGITGNNPSPIGSLTTIATLKTALTGIMSSISGAVTTIINPLIPTITKVLKILGAGVKKLLGG